MNTSKIAIFVGSLRKESYSRKIAQLLTSLPSNSLILEIVEIGNLPIYNEDLEDDLPDGWKTFRNKLRAYDGVIFVTPEYNRSMPGVLKNALDVGSRPYGFSIWNGKPAAIISVSQGAMGGFGANHHLRQSLVFLNAAAMAQPEMYIGEVSKLIDQDGNFTNEDTLKFLQSGIDAFETWISRNATHREILL
jgi:chromate reductase